jgi:hypothetical protein
MSIPRAPSLVITGWATARGYAGERHLVLGQMAYGLTRLRLGDDSLSLEAGDVVPFVAEVEQQLLGVFTGLG